MSSTESIAAADGGVDVVDATALGPMVSGGGASQDPVDFVPTQVDSTSDHPQPQLDGEAKAPRTRSRPSRARTHMGAGTGGNNKHGLKDGTLRTLDLFSGVGGLTRALHGLAVPVAYCDVALDARQSLHYNMRAGRVPWAPICTNVKALTKEWVEATCELRTVDMIVGGFPCVGFSPMGRQEGFEERQSSLFHEILRLADELAVPALLLENVPAVLNLGMDTIADELSVKRGYELRWCVVAAEDVGAPHKRARWYCLAVKPGFKHAWKVASDYEMHAWTEQDVPVTAIPRGATNRATKAASGLMGNSVVPDGVRFAFLHMLARCGADVTELSTPAGLSLVPAASSVDDASGSGKAGRRGRSGANNRWPVCGVLPAGGKSSSDAFAMPGPGVLRAPLALKLEFDPAAYQSRHPPSAQLTTSVLKKPEYASKWATPRHGSTMACNYLTERSIRDLPTQVRFATVTPPELRGGGLNPAFTEWLMGYPAGWVSEQAFAYVPPEGAAADEDETSNDAAANAVEEE